MPQPAEVRAIRDELAQLYRDAQAAIDARLAAIADEGARRAVLRRRLTELAREVDRLVADLDRQATTWLARRYPLVYQAGGDQAATDSGIPFQWAQTHIDAVTELARDAHGDLLAATTFMRRDAKTLIRAASRAATRASVVEGDTARQAARDLARTLTERGVKAVRYSNGARVGIGDYAEMVVRTKTAQAFNAGTLNHLDAAGVQFVEVFDGPSCGWTSHDDSDLANGTIRTVDEARATPIAHPNCARSFGGRPDLASRRQAAGATRPAGERAQLATAERARARAQQQANRRLARRTRRRSPARTRR